MLLVLAINLVINRLHVATGAPARCGARVIQRRQDRAPTSATPTATSRGAARGQPGGPRTTPSRRCSARPAAARRRCCVPQPPERPGSPAGGLIGQVLIDGQDIYAPGSTWRRCGGGSAWSSPCPCPCRRRILENVTYGPRLMRHPQSARRLPELAEKAMRDAAIWDEVNGPPGDHAFALSGGQQQRLSLARVAGASSPR